MVAKLGVAADSSDYFKVKEISELLRSKGVKPRGKKAQKCKQVALVCTAEEVQAFRQEKEAKALAALVPKKRDAGQLSIEESVKRMRSRCTHDWAREFPPGPRDNGEYRDVCQLCNAVWAQAYMAGFFGVEYNSHLLERDWFWHRAGGGSA